MPIDRNQPIGTYTFYKRLYSLRTALAYGQLSCAIFPFSCPYITQQRSTLFNSWQTRLNVFWKKSHRKADHMDTAILDSDRLFQTVYIQIGWFLSIGTVYSYHDGVQASSVEIAWSRERNNIFKVSNWTNNDVPCTDMCIPGTTNVQTSIYKSKLIHLGIFQVYIKTNGFAI